MPNFRVLHITNNIEEYPHATKDSDEFPHVVNWLEDEYGMFVLDDSTGSIYPAGEFFYMMETDFKGFSTDTQQLEDELFVATNYIRSIRTQCAQAKTAKEEHLACWAAVNESPWLLKNRIELRDKDKTFIAMKRKA